LEEDVQVRKTADFEEEEGSTQEVAEPSGGGSKK